MGSGPKYSQPIIEALEACRPGSDDLADPQMAQLQAHIARDPELDDLHARLQKLDVQLAGALFDLDVPPGLADRLLARLSETAVASEVEPVESRPCGGIAAVSVARVAVRRTGWLARSRRWLVASAALAMVLVVAVALWPRGPAQYTAGAVLEAAVEFFHNDPGGEAKLVSQASPPWAFPYSRALISHGSIRWRRVEGLLGVRGLAYDLPSGGAGRATLYVVDCPVSDLPDEPPLRPSYSTANCSCAVWMEHGLAYILVVRGDSGDYESLLNVARGPVT